MVSENGLGDWIAGLGLLLIAEDSMREQGQLDGAQIFGRCGQHRGMGGGVVQIHDVRSDTGCAAGEQIAGNGGQLVRVARHKIRIVLRAQRRGEAWLRQWPRLRPARGCLREMLCRYSSRGLRPVTRCQNAESNEGSM